MGKRFRHDATNFFRQYFCDDSIISQGNSIITRWVLKMELFYTSYSELLRWEKYRDHLLWDRSDLAAEIDFRVRELWNRTVNLTLLIVRKLKWIIFCMDNNYFLQQYMVRYCSRVGISGVYIYRSLHIILFLRIILFIIIGNNCRSIYVIWGHLRWILFSEKQAQDLDRL